MKLREHFQIFRRAAKFTFSMNRKYTVLLIINAVLSSIIGYVPIYFSAKVIDSLVAKSPIETVILYVALTVGIVFTVNLLNTYIASEKNIAYSVMWRNEDWAYSEKAMQMAYESIEDPEVTRLRYRIRRESQFGQNLFYLYQHIERFTGQATKIIASIALTISFFTISSVPVVYKLYIVVGMFITLIVQVFATKKINDLTLAFNESCVNENIVSEHFQDYMKQYASGKDIRLYDMGDFVGDSFLESQRTFFERALKNSYKKAVWTLPVTILNTVLKFGIYAVLIYAALQGGITIGSIAKYVACIMLLAETMINIIKTIQEALNNNHYLKRYFSYFDIPNNMYQGSLTVEKRDDNEYYVEFRNVSFKYPHTEAKL